MTALTLIPVLVTPANGSAEPPSGITWAEGLKTCLSDYLNAEREGRGWEYRKRMLIDYWSYTTPGKEFALKDFRGGSDYPSRAPGYGKSVMVFHMLKGLVGEEAFHEALRGLVEGNVLSEGSWGDIEAVFEKVSGRKLAWFFEQWVHEKEVPFFEIKNVSINPKGLRYAVSFDIVQKDRTFVANLPVSVTTDQGETRQTLEVKEKIQSFEMVVDGSPERLVLDADYDVFRRLSEEEMPPVIAKVLAEQRGLLVLPENVEPPSPLKEAVDFFRDRGYTPKEPKEVKLEDLRKASVVVLGSANPVLKRLFAMPASSSPGLSFAVRTNPLNRSEVIAVLDADSGAEVRASLDKITRYGEYSAVVFKEGKNVEEKVPEGERGLPAPLKEPVPGLEVPKALTLEEITEKVSGKRIIYIGEQHDKYEHHVAQLELIRGLFRKNSRLAIGMEMFRRSSQKALDDYIAGRIDEREFLKSSEYFKRWGVDYNQYKNILRFARDLGIPVVALNIRREIVSKVAKTGLDSLTEEEKKELPAGMDLSDEEYKKRLREVFEKHEGARGRNFDNFYQSQVIWDEIMSESIDDFLRNNPDYRFVAIAGGGHFAFGSGIPKRTFRRNGLAYAVVLNDNPVEKEIADFLLFPPSVAAARAPKLMAMLKEEEGRVKIAAFPEKSVSEKAGLKTDDVIVSLDGEKVAGVDDIQIFLFYKKPGDVVKVKVLRKRFLLGEKEREFEVTL